MKVCNQYKSLFWRAPLLWFFICISLSACASHGKINQYDVKLIEEAQQANQFIEQSNYEKGIEFYKKALLKYQAQHNQAGALFSLEKIGWMYREKGDLEESFKYFHKAYPIGLQLNGDAAEIEADFGDILLMQGDKEKAAQHYNKALSALSSFEFPTSFMSPPSKARISEFVRKSKAIIQSRIQLAAIDLGAQHYDQAIMRLAKTDKLIKDILYVGSHPLYSLFYKEDEQIYEGKGYTDTYFGAAYGGKGDYEKSSAYFQSGKQSFIKARKPFGLIVNEILSYKFEEERENQAAEDWVTKGDYKKALDEYEKILASHLSHQKFFKALKSMTRMSWLLRELGDYGRAKEILAKARPIGLQVNGDTADVDVHLGDVYSFSGDADQALKLYGKALDALSGFSFPESITTPPTQLELNQLIRKSKAIIQARIQKAVIYYFRGDPDAALVELHKSDRLITRVQKVYNHPFLNLFFQPKSDLNEGIGFYHTVMGAVLSAKGDFKTASEQFDVAAVYFQKSERPFGSLVNHALRIKTELLSPPAAIDFKKYDAFLKQAERFGAVEIVWRTGYEMGKAAAKTGRFDRAEHYLRQAIDALESTRSRFHDDAMKQVFASSVQDVYAEMIQVLFQRKEFSKGFEYLERSKARGFLDILAGRTLKPKPNVPASLIAKEGDLQEQLDIVLKQVKNAVGDEKKLAKQHYNELLNQRKEVLDELRKKSLEYASTKSVAILSTDEILKKLAHDEALVSYFMSDDRTLIWILYHGVVSAISVPYGRQEIKSLVQDFRYKILTRLDWGGTHAERGFNDVSPSKTTKPRTSNPDRKLAKILLQPIKSKISGAKRILFIPTGALNYLPFSALPSGKNRFLIQDYALAFLPNATSLEFIGKNISKKADALLAFGNPKTNGEQQDLPYAEKEVKQIGELFSKKTIYIKDQAKESMFKNTTLTGFKAIHFAAHGIYNKQFPLKSSIILSKDEKENGHLETYEIFSLNMNPQVVILSACQSGVGQATAGDEVQSLNRAFIYAGAGGVISSLWNVADLSTYQLMKSFYSEFNNHSAAESLRLAQLKLMKKFPAPFFWAPFYLTGKNTHE